MSARLRIVTYNIHKGYAAWGGRYVLKDLKQELAGLRADLALLQEVSGLSKNHDDRQFEVLADELWNHYAYGKNALTRLGHHGNAILSRFPMRFAQNYDLSLDRLEQRGLLYAVLGESLPRPLHVFTTHLNLGSVKRGIQIEKVLKTLQTTVPEDAPTLLGGDFNDWDVKIHQKLKDAGFREVFEELTGQLARSFPSVFPVLRLDRVYYKNLKPLACDVSRIPRRNSSDHLPLVTELGFLP